MIFACALALPLAACKEDDEETASGPDPDACNASQFQHLVGRDEAAVAEAGIEPGQKTRIFGPGDMLTMDYRSDRINVELDAVGEVVRVYCG